MVLDIPANIVTGIKQGFDILVHLTILATVATLVAVFLTPDTLAPPGTPFFAFTGTNLLGTYLVGFPDCKSNIGPMEGCLLPSKNLILAIPDSINRFQNSFSIATTRTPAVSVKDGETNVLTALQSQLDFIAILVSFLTIPFLLAKVLVTIKVLTRGFEMYTQYNQWANAQYNS